MRKTLVYDLPTRIFHWTFVILFFLSFVIAKTVDSEDLVFIYHMLTGLLLGALVLFRIFWGFAGSKHARFSGFNLNPIELKNYFLGILSRSKKRWSGHNPASSWAAVVMLVLGIGLSVTGYFMRTGYKEQLEDYHEIMANTFIVVVIMHIAGVILHSVLHRDMIALSMVDGKKELTQETEAISDSNRVAGIIFIFLIATSALYIYKNFDPEKRTLTLFNQTLQMSDHEESPEPNN